MKKLSSVACLIALNACNCGAEYFTIRPDAGVDAGEGEGEALVGEGEGDGVTGEGEGDVVGEGEGDAVVGEGEGDLAAGEGEGDVAGEGEGDVVGEGEGEGEGDTGPNLDFIAIPGGTFSMGSTRSSLEQPVHTVTVPAFELMRAEVAAADYRLCVEDGTCLAPTITAVECNFGSDRETTDPMNCLDGIFARTFCTWAGARLPTEAEWEFAARRDTGRTYPWGEDAPTCARAGMNESGTAGCGTGLTSPSCTRPSGNSIDGLCDLSGNVWEWVEDDFHFDYVNAPNDGSAFVDDPRGSSQSYRGGSFAGTADVLTSTVRNGFDPLAGAMVSIGFRCAR